MCGCYLWFVCNFIKSLPYWKEVRIRESEVHTIQYTPTIHPANLARARERLRVKGLQCQEMVLINGHDFRIMDGESRIFWTLPENPSKKKRSNMQKQVEPKETKR